MKSTNTNASIIVLWWLMNFGMPEVFESLITFPPILCLLVTARELIRNQKIYSAVDKSIVAYDKRKKVTIIKISS